MIVFLCVRAEVRSEPSQASEVELFGENRLTAFSRVTVFKNSSILDL